MDKACSLRISRALAKGTVALLTGPSAGFGSYWRWRSRPSGGRPKITAEIRELIRRLAQENADWGAPKIHGELLQLGFVVYERSVARYLRRIRRRSVPGKGCWGSTERKTGLV